MHDGIISVEIALCQIPKVLLHIFNVVIDIAGRGAEITAGKKVSIQTNYLMPCRTQDRPCHGAYISLVTG
jgi:hypothetical protein